MSSVLAIETAEVFEPLLRPARYKGIHGGRGSGKSQFFGDLWLEESISEKLDFVCLRETLKSLEFSVKKLLESKIERFNAGAYFEVQDRRILSKLGGVTIFEGMQNHTAESIKSLEGFDRAWFEEAQNASDKSLTLLRPTIRKPGSQLWFGWNPLKATDPIDQLLRGETPPPDAIVVQANYMDNPWLPDVLREEMEYDKRRDPDKYAHVWLGEYQRNSEARVFKNWRVEEFERPEGTVFRLGADWGFSVDPSVLVRSSIEGNRLYVDHEAYAIGCEIVNLPELFMGVPESEKWPITADSARPETISHMQRHGFPKIRAAIKGAKSLEDGIEWLKSFDIVVHPRCKHLIDELTLYSYKTDPLTGEVLPLLADKDNHCLVAGTMVATRAGDKPIEQVTTQDEVLTRAGYKQVLFAGVTDMDRRVLRVETTHGSITCTPNHKVFTANKGFVRADALRYNDEVVSFNEGPSCQRLSSTEERFTGAIRTVQSVLTACISSGRSLAVRFGFIGKSGRTHTVQSLTAGMSTTRMATLSTTTWATLSAYRPRITSADMSGMTTGAVLSGSIWSQSALSPKSGTQAMRASPSTERSALRHTSGSRLLPSSVSSAGMSFSPTSSGTLIGSALESARRLSGALVAWMTRRASVFTAAHRSPATSTPSRRLAHGRVLTVTEAGRADLVYDLTVQDQPEFFANGVLVHNCIDALRYACEGARRAGLARPRREIKTTPELNNEGWMSA